MSHDWDGLRGETRGWGGGIFVVIGTRVIAIRISEPSTICPSGSQVLGISGEQADMIYHYIYRHYIYCIYLARRDSFVASYVIFKISRGLSLQWNLGIQCSDVLMNIE